MPSSLQLKKINKFQLGLREGNDLQGAAYYMGDFGDDLNRLAARGERLRHIMTPVRGGEWEREWCTRYLNTVALCKRLRPQGGQLLLVSRAFGTGERYETKTFRKCNSLPKEAEILGRIKYGADDTPTDIMLRITAAIDALPDPGSDFL